uniref:Uncharacterized protein n=1 Tax=Tanacetum cinerariifolium TaxID=118510 RepID=A0A6L2P2K9_TANCI|nr:hypothetical protein [Tanacetum cinerariifolium]
MLTSNGFSLKVFDPVTASTPTETSKPLLKDAEAEDVDVHLYRSMIGSLMYLTASRPDIMFVVCACARFQDSPFELEAYTDSDYAGASLDRKSTIGEYVAAVSCCGQVLWIQNQMLDYGYNFMNTKIFIDNGSTICIVKNLVFHSKTKHIGIQHHFIRDSNEKKLIQMIKIHTDQNVADLLIKAFDKPTESKGFEQIIDFLNANPIKYALTVNPTIYTLCVKQFWATVKVKTVNGEEQIQALVDKKKVIITESSVKSDLHIEDAEVKLKAYSNIKRFMLHLLTPRRFFANMKRQGKDFSGKVTPVFETMMVQPQEDMGQDLEIQTHSHHTPTVTQPSTSSQPQQKQKSKKSKKRINEVPQVSDSTHDVADEHVTTTSNDPLLSGVALVDETHERNDQDMFDTSILDDEEVVIEKEVSTANPVPTASEVVTNVGVEVSTATITSQFSMDEITLVKALIDIKTSKHKKQGIVMQEPSETPTPTPIDSSQQSSKAKNKGKAKMIEPEKPLKRKDQIMIDEEVFRNLEAQTQAELEEEERLPRQKKEEANIALIESWDNTQAMMDADYKLAVRLQEEKRGELTIEEKSRLFVELIDKRKKYFARIRAEKIKKLVKGSEKVAKCRSKRTGGKLEKEDAKREDLEVLWSFVKAIFKKIKPVDDMDNPLVKVMYLNEVFGYILLIKTKLLIKKLEDSEGKHQVYGRIVRIKRLHDDIRVPAAQVYISAVKLNLVLFIEVRLLRDEDWKYAK